MEYGTLCRSSTITPHIYHVFFFIGQPHARVDLNPQGADPLPPSSTCSEYS